MWNGEEAALTVAWQRGLSSQEEAADRSVSKKREQKQPGMMKESFADHSGRTEVF